MKDKIYLSEEAAERIIQSLVVTASNDYRKIFRKRLKGIRLTKETEEEFDELEEFFESQWFTALTNMDGSYIMAKLEQDERRKRREKVNIKTIA